MARERCISWGITWSHIPLRNAIGEVMNDGVPAIYMQPVLPMIIAEAGNHAGIRFLEFFASNIRNPNTRRAYAHAVGIFMDWRTQAGVTSITSVQPLHVAAWIELQIQTLSAPTVKQNLAAIRHLFDWFVTGQRAA